MYNPEEAREVSLSQNVQTFPTAHPDPYLFCIGEYFFGCTKAGAYCILHCNVEVKDKWNCTSTTPVCLHLDYNYLKMEPAFSSETPVPTYQTTLCHNERYYTWIPSFKSLNYILVEIVNVKMGSTCSFEILCVISILKAIKLNVVIAFPPHSFKYGVTH